MRIVFMGSPEFALPSLQRLAESEHEVVGVFTQPDRPTGRGRRLAPPPVKALALEYGIPVFQPKSISRPDAVDQLRALAPDIGIIAAYGQILRQPVLDLPPLGILNVHASLLPRWRGAAPIPAAILAGDAETGATIMKVVLALDAGPILASVPVTITAADTTATLMPRVAEAGAALLLDVLPRYASGSLPPVPQDDDHATYSPQLTKEDGRIDWAAETAEHIARKVRAYNPWPIAFTTLEGQPLRILEARPAAKAPNAVRPGTVLAGAGNGFPVATIDGALEIVAVQPSGRRAMPAEAFQRGKPGLAGRLLG
ncbi:MAG: methionyl-tRNA formyltransferase [Chloroflexi bacterium]|nr:methionyl-tRNA formyltransferase [Chloroflexota bacterium]